MISPKLTLATVVALILSTIPAYSQLAATAKPISITGSAAALGGGSIGFWQIQVCSSYPLPVDLPRERITQAFPTLRDIPNHLAEDLLSRHASNSFWSVVARWGPTVMTMGGAALGTKGLLSNNITQIASGQAMSLFPLLFARAGQRAPNPGVYYSDLLPDRVALAAYGCGTWMLASGIVRGAAPMAGVIELPGIAGIGPSVVGGTTGIGTTVTTPLSLSPNVQLAIERLEKILSTRNLDAQSIGDMIATFPNPNYADLH